MTTEEPEVTPRKLGIAAVCLLGSTFVPYVQAILGPLMMLPMIQEFGWTRTEFAFGTTFFFVFGAATVLVFGRLADRLGPRTILLLGSVCGGATMLLLSQQDAQLWRLYLAFALLGAFGSSGLGYTKIIGTLFARHRGGSDASKHHRGDPEFRDWDRPPRDHWRAQSAREPDRSGHTGNRPSLNYRRPQDPVARN